MGKNDFEISFSNCRNISSTGSNPITIRKNRLNILYGKNGVGKTTFCRVLNYLANQTTDTLEKIKSFEYLDTSDPDLAPNASCASRIKSIRIFNDEWIDSHCFEKSNLHENAYELYVRDSSIRALEKQRARLLARVRSVMHGPEVEYLNDCLSSISKGVGKTKQSDGTFVATSPAVKAFAHGVPTEVVPKELSGITRGMTAKQKAEWLSWHTNAPDYLPPDKCPYCGTKDAKRLDACHAYDQTRNSSELKKWANLASTFEQLKDLLSRSDRAAFNRVLSSKTSPKTLDIEALQSLAKDAETMAGALRDITDALDDESCFDVPNLISRLRPDISTITACKFFKRTSHGKETEVGAAIRHLSSAVYCLINAQTVLDSTSKSLRNKIAANVSGHESEINRFLAQSGYSYTVKIEVNHQTADARILLQPNSAHNAVDEPGSALSYGERNALALILFMFEVLHEKPALIVLDDPISSFDYDKRYGILFALFSHTDSVFNCNLSNKTVLVLTHDFLVVSDLINIPGKGMSRALGQFITIDAGGVLHATQMNKDALIPYTQLLKNAIRNAKTRPEIFSLVYIRQLCELLRPDARELRTKEGWTFRLLSEIIHGRSEQDILEKHNWKSKSQRGVSACENYVRSLTGRKFDFWSAVTRYSNYTIDLVNLYESERLSSLDKLLIVRLLIEREPSLAQDAEIMKRFADESCHIGGSYLFQLDGERYDQVPYYVTLWCDEIVGRAKVLYEPTQPSQQSV